VSACTEIAPLITFRTLGVLEPQERTRLEEHLATCSSCPKRAQALKKALEVTKLPVVRAPEGGWEKIDAAIGEPRALPVVGVACTYCKDSFGSSARVFCAACLAPYHPDCFREHGKCAVAGCGETKVVSAQTLPRSARPRPIALLAVALATGLGGVAAWSLRGTHAPEPPRVAEKSQAESPATPVQRYYTVFGSGGASDLAYFQREHESDWRVDADEEALVGKNSSPRATSSLWIGDDSWTDLTVILKFRILEGRCALHLRQADATTFTELDFPDSSYLPGLGYEVAVHVGGDLATVSHSVAGVVPTNDARRLKLAAAHGSLGLTLDPGASIAIEQMTVVLETAAARAPLRGTSPPAPVENSRAPAPAGREHVLLDPAKPALDYFEPEHLWVWRAEGKLLVGDNSEGEDPSSLWFGDSTWDDIEGRVRFRILKGSLAIRVHVKDEAFYEPLVVQPTMRNGALVAEWQECHFLLLHGKEFIYTTSFDGFTSTPSRLEVSGAPGKLAFTLPAGAVVELERVSVTVSAAAKEPAKHVSEEPLRKKRPERREYPLSVVRYPVDAPVYAVVGTAPKARLEGYASFAALVREKLVDLIESGSGKKIPWVDRPCKTCHGKGVFGEEKKCPQCGGTGREPSTIYVLGSQKEFMEKTHVPETVDAFFFPGGNFEFYESPVVTFDDDARGARLHTLAREVTHQTEQLAWSGESVKARLARPVWLTEGLAMLMGEGLLPSLEGVVGFEVPRDRLRQVQRRLEATPGLSVEQILTLDMPRFQMDPSLVAFAWSIVHYMALSGEKLDVEGRTVDLRAAFGTFFIDNCKHGAIEELGADGGSRGLARAMGFTSDREVRAALRALDQGWKRWVRGLEPEPVGKVSDGRYAAPDRLGISFAVPEGFAMEPESALRPFEAVAFKNGERRFEVFVTASTGVSDLASGARLAGSALQEKVEPAGDGVEVTIEGAKARVFDVANGKALVVLARGRLFVVLGDASAVTDVSRSLRLESR
jgi:hypothetical protein